MSLARLFTPRRLGFISVGALVAAGLSIAAFAQQDQQVAQNGGRGPQGRQMDNGGQRPDRCARLAEHLGQIDKKLSPEQIRDIVAGRLAVSGENNLKVGKVQKKDGDVVSVDVVTNSGSLVVNREISSKTGLPADLVKNCQTAQARFTAMRAKADAANGGQGGPQQHDGHGGWNGRDGHGGHMMHGRSGGHGMHHRGGMENGEIALIANVGPGRDLNLSVDQTHKLADAAVVMLGNPRLKVGAVKEKDADTMTVDIVTQDGALVMRREVDRHTGHMKKAA